MKVPVLYISTDYVFDGSSPPYEATDKPNPINQYGKTKLKGEEITLKYSGKQYLVKVGFTITDTIHDNFIKF